MLKIPLVACYKVLVHPGQSMETYPYFVLMGWYPVPYYAVLWTSVCNLIPIQNTRLLMVAPLRCHGYSYGLEDSGVSPQWCQGKRNFGSKELLAKSCIFRFFLELHLICELLLFIY